MATPSRPSLGAALNQIWWAERMVVTLINYMWLMHSEMIHEKKLGSSISTKELSMRSS